MLHNPEKETMYATKGRPVSHSNKYAGEHYPRALVCPSLYLVNLYECCACNAFLAYSPASLPFPNSLMFSSMLSFLARPLQSQLTHEFVR